MRAALLLLTLATTSLFAAPPKPEKTPPPTDTAPQNIDVDALARAKDVGAAQSTDAASAAAATPPAENAANEAAAAPVEDASAAPAAAPATGDAADAATSPANAPALTKPAMDPQEQRAASGCASRATHLLDAAQKGDYPTAIKEFDAKMRSASPAPKFKQMWESLTQFGVLQARGEAHPGKGDGYYFVMTPLIFEKTTLIAQVVCGSDGLIAGFNVKPLSSLQ